MKKIKIKIKTKKNKEILDITEEIEKYLVKIDGICHLFVLHTTCALTTADLDPGTDLDTLDFFEAIIPKLKFRHPHDPNHAPDHILSSLVGSSLSLPIKDGKIVLGIWQRVVLVEFSGPREREILISLLS